jgi:hypothetical protein
VITRWKVEPLYPKPFSPVQRARKFSAVRGTTSARRVISMRPSGEPLADISKKTTGLDMVEKENWGRERVNVGL